MTSLSQDQHDRAVRFIAANRFPFPDQPHPSWPLHYRTYINTPTHPRRGIEGPDGLHHPDIVIVDGDGRTREIGEVEMDFGPETVARWRAASDAADDTTETGCRHLLVYVPEGREAEALALLEGNAVSYHALRGVRVDPDGTVHVLPHRTIGNGKDHRPDSPPPAEADPVVEVIDAAAHDAVQRFVLAERFPFPGEDQTHWALDLHALTNTRLHQRKSVPFEGGEIWPDIVVVDAEGRTCKLAEVEMPDQITEASVPRWKALSDAAAFKGHYTDPTNGRPAKHFLLYVPMGLEAKTRALLVAGGVSCAGIRGYRVTKAGRVSLPEILPPVVPLEG